MTEAGSDRSPLQSIVAALDAGHLAADQLSTTSSFHPKSGRVRLLRGLPGLARYVADSAKHMPSAEALRRAADSVDAFANELNECATALGDEELELLAAHLAPVGRAVWDGSRDSVDAYRLVTEVNGVLQRHRTRQILGRDAGFDD